MQTVQLKLTLQVIFHMTLMQNATIMPIITEKDTIVESMIVEAITVENMVVTNE